MNKNQTAEDAKIELKETMELEILSDPNEEREYEQMMQRSTTLDQYITEMQNAEYSEFMIGACVAVQLMTHNKKLKVGNGWTKMKNILTPAFMKK